MHKKLPRPLTGSGARAERLLPTLPTRTESVNDQLHVDLAIDHLKYDHIIIDFDIGYSAFLCATS